MTVLLASGLAIKKTSRLQFLRRCFWSPPQYQARLEKFNEDLISDNSALRKELNAVKQQLRNQGITPVTPEPPVTPAPVVPKSSKNTTGDQNNGPDVDMSFLSKQ